MRKTIAEIISNFSEPQQAIEFLATLEVEIIHAKINITVAAYLADATTTRDFDEILEALRIPKEFFNYAHEILVKTEIEEML